MDDLLPIARRVGERLVQRNESVAVAESSAGGLISAALLAVPGASRFFLGGAVAYTRDAREALLGVRPDSVADITPSTEAYASVLANALRSRLPATWALAETGTAGPTGSRYGHGAGHACFAVAGPVEKSLTLETGHADRERNMREFAAGALRLLEQVLSQGR